MARQKKTIITCAVTGAIHTPTMSDALPYTYDDIAREAIEAAEAGASILHLHARDNETGAPSVNLMISRGSCHASNRRPMLWLTYRLVDR